MEIPRLGLKSVRWSFDPERTGRHNSGTIFTTLLSLFLTYEWAQKTSVTINYSGMACQ